MNMERAEQFVTTTDGWGYSSERFPQINATEVLCDFLRSRGKTAGLTAL
jgi:hypothetical protein